MKGIFLAGCLFFCVFGFTQNKGSLSGWVVDKNTQFPIAGVSVKVLNTPYSTVTDSNGKYVIKSIPTGQYQIKFISIGSYPLTLFNVIVKNPFWSEIAPMFRSLTLTFTFSKGRLVYSSITVPDIFVCEKTLVLLKARRKRSVKYKYNFFNNLCLKFIYK